MDGIDHGYVPPRARASIVRPVKTAARPSGTTTSLATGQRSLRDPSITYPLFPPLTEGCPRTSNAEMQYPVDVTFHLARVDRTLFDRPVAPGLARWAPLLPPLAPGLDLGEGGTPLVAVPRLAKWAGLEGELYLKDETRNPTWSHKDRLNVVTTSAALQVGAPGVVVASTGNHGAAAAAYASAAGLRCIVITGAGAPPSMQRYLVSYGAAVVAVPSEARWPMLREVAKRLGFHPASNVTPVHTGHGWAPEAYKSIAYELFAQLDRRVPGAVFVPTGYAELLFGIWKGFVELRELGVTATVPRMYPCEPGVRAPLARALAEGRDATKVAPAPSAAPSIAATVNGYRGVLTVRESDGRAVTVNEDEITSAHRAQSRAGFWHELSSATGLAGVKRMASDGWRADGPVVIISTSAGFKFMELERPVEVPEVAGEWDAVAAALRGQGIAA